MFTLLAALYDFPCQFSALIDSALPVTTLADDFEPSFHTFTAGVPFPAEYHEKLDLPHLSLELKPHFQSVHKLFHLPAIH